MGIAKRRRKQAGCKQCDGAVGERHADSERNQRVHVEVARHERIPAAHEERPRGPKNHRDAQNELNPTGESWVRQRHVQAGQVFGHCHPKNRNREREPYPEPARHVEQLGVGLVVRAWCDRLQRHAAFRTVAGPRLPDLRVHRAGVDRARHRDGRRGGLPCRLGVPPGLGSELVETMPAAEIPLPAGVRVLVFGGRSIQRHAANRVKRKARRGRSMSLRHRAAYSTVTDFARFLGLSTSLPLSSAAW